MMGNIKKLWTFLWDSDSLLSWLLNIVIAFLLIYFLVYPGLGFLFKTTHPIVAVVSESMEHDGSFEDWWNSPTAICNDIQCTQGEFYNSIGITKEEFMSFPSYDGFNKGDIMLLKGYPPDEIKTGDIIVFQTNRPDPIIHRVIMIEQEDSYYYTTKGDHNTESFSTSTLNEININEKKSVGYAKYNKVSKAVLRIPYLGWIKIAYVKHPVIFVLCFIIFITIVSNFEKIKKVVKK